MTEDEEDIAAEREAQALKQQELQVKQKRAEQEQQERESELRAVQQHLATLAVKHEENIALMEAMVAHAQKAKELEATHESLKKKMQALSLDCAKLIEPPQTPPGKSAPPSAERSVARELQPLATANTPSAAKVQLPA